MPSKYLSKCRVKCISLSEDKKGFTLIELLVVITILAVLSAIGMVAYSGVQKNARDARRKADLNKINIYLEAYRASNGKYPQAGSCGYGTNCYVFSSAGENWIPALISTGVTNRLPVDPINNGTYPWRTNGYTYSYGNVLTDGQSYDLTAQLENTNDSERCEVKDWKFYFDNHSWCQPSGGGDSPQIYEASPDR